VSCNRMCTTSLG